MASWPGRIVGGLWMLSIISVGIMDTLDKGRVMLRIQ